MRNLLAVVILWMSASLACCADFEAANQLYDQGRFAEAKTAYEGLVGEGKWSANLFYNLGCTSHRLGAPGEAVLEYQRALMLEPGHPEALANLTFLHTEMGGIPWPGSWLDRLLPKQWADGCTVLGALAAWAIVFMIARRPTGAWMGLIAALLVGGYCAALVWRAEQGADRAIVTAKASEARFAPATSAGAAAVLPAGSEVRVLTERGEWAYCALPMGGRGWIAAKELARVRLAAS